MKKSWWQKKEAEPKKRLFIPEDKIAEFYELEAAGKDNFTKYQLWRFLADIFPEIDNGKGWQTGRSTFLHPYVEEV